MATGTIDTIFASGSPEVQMNEAFVAVKPAGLFGNRGSTTTGLVFGYYGGVIWNGSAYEAIADGTLTLDASQAAVYIEVDSAGVVSKNLVGFTAGSTPLYLATTSATVITALTDYRTVLPQLAKFPAVTLENLTIASGTITASNPALSITQTWNDAGVTFVGADTNITVTAAAAASLVERWRVGGTEILSLRKDGLLTAHTLTVSTGALTVTSGQSRHIVLSGSATSPAVSVTAGNLLLKTSGGTQVQIDNTAAADRYLTITGGVSGSGTNATIGVSGGDVGVSASLAITGALSGSAASKLALAQGSSATSSVVAYGPNAGTVGILQLECKASDGTGTGIVMKLQAGVQFGAPTGGDKGAGTANFAGDIYKNNSAYTNPDYVLEHWATGKIVKYAEKAGAANYAGLLPLSDIEAFARTNWHLPRFGQQAGHGAFSGGEALLASVEEAYLHLFDHESRLAALVAWKSRAESALVERGITIH